MVDNLKKLAERAASFAADAADGGDVEAATQWLYAVEMAERLLREYA